MGRHWVIFYHFFRKYCKHENTIFGCGECHWIKFFPMLSIRFHTRRPRLIRTSLSTQIWFNCFIYPTWILQITVCYFKIYHFDLNNISLEKLTVNKVLFTRWTLQNVHVCIHVSVQITDHCCSLMMNTKFTVLHFLLPQIVVM